MAAIRHVRPEFDLEQGLMEAADWWGKHSPGRKRYYLKQYDRWEDGTFFYVASSPADASLVEGTLGGFFNLISLQEGEDLLIETSLPYFPGKWYDQSSRMAVSTAKLNSFWREIGVAVKEARLQGFLKEVRL